MTTPWSFWSMSRLRMRPGLCLEVGKEFQGFPLSRLKIKIRTRCHGKERRLLLEGDCHWARSGPWLHLFVFTGPCARVPRTKVGGQLVFLSGCCRCACLERAWCPPDLPIKPADRSTKTLASFEPSSSVMLFLDLVLACMNITAFHQLTDSHSTKMNLIRDSTFSPKK